MWKIDPPCQPLFEVTRIINFKCHNKAIGAVGMVIPNLCDTFGVFLII